MFGLANVVFVGRLIDCFVFMNYQCHERGLNSTVSLSRYRYRKKPHSTQINLIFKRASIIAGATFFTQLKHDSQVEDNGDCPSLLCLLYNSSYWSQRLKTTFRERTSNVAYTSVCLEQKPGESGVRRRDGVVIFLGCVVRVLEVHLLPGLDMDDGLDGRLAVVAVPAVRQSHGHDPVAHHDGAVHVLAGAQIIGHDGGLEVVESRHRRCEDPGQRIVGVADVGDRVVQDDGSMRCCLHGVGVVPGVEGYRLVQRG